MWVHGKIRRRERPDERWIQNIRKDMKEYQMADDIEEK